MNTKPETPHEDNTLVPSGRCYDSVEAMLRDQGMPELAERIRIRAQKTRVARSLAAQRMRVGLTQAQFAEKAKLTQGAVSKIESMEDEKITLRHLNLYANITGSSLFLELGQAVPAAQRVKFHALRMRDALKELAQLSEKYEELRQSIGDFNEEVLANLLIILAECRPAQPKPGKKRAVADTSQMRMDLYTEDTIGFSRSEKPTEPLSCAHCG